MTDHLSPEIRSALMARIRGRDTKPELIVRRLIHSLGYRYRLHRRDLPGTPDLVFPSRRQVVFVHGCFWHHHDCLRGALPRSNQEFWKHKLDQNTRRDRENLTALQNMGWAVLVIWECQTRDPAGVADRVCRFLSTDSEGDATVSTRAV